MKTSRAMWRRAALGFCMLGALFWTSGCDDDGGHHHHDDGYHDGDGYHGEDYGYRDYVYVVQVVDRWGYGVPGAWVQFTLEGSSMSGDRTDHDGRVAFGFSSDYGRRIFIDAGASGYYDAGVDTYAGPDSEAQVTVVLQGW